MPIGPDDDMEGLFHIAEVYPLVMVGKRQQLSDRPLDMLWPCSAQPFTRRDLLVQAQGRANQHVLAGNLLPRIEPGWKLMVYARTEDDECGQFIAEYRTTDPDVAPGPVGGLHHQEVQANKILHGNVDS